MEYTSGILLNFEITDGWIETGKCNRFCLESVTFAYFGRIAIYNHLCPKPLHLEVINSKYRSNKGNDEKFEVIPIEPSNSISYFNSKLVCQAILFKMS